MKSKKIVKFDFSSGPCDGCPVDANEADVVDIGWEHLNEVAIENDCRWYGLPLEAVTLAQVRDTSAGITGWAKYDGPEIHDPYVEPPIIPTTVPAPDVARAKAKHDKRDIGTKESFLSHDRDRSREE